MKVFGKAKSTGDTEMATKRYPYLPTDRLDRPGSGSTTPKRTLLAPAGSSKLCSEGRPELRNWLCNVYSSTDIHLVILRHWRFACNRHTTAARPLHAGLPPCHTRTYQIRLVTRGKIRLGWRWLQRALRLRFRCQDWFRHLHWKCLLAGLIATFPTHPLLGGYWFYQNPP